MPVRPADPLEDHDGEQLSPAAPAAPYGEGVPAVRPALRLVADVALPLLVLVWFGLTGFLAWRGFGASLSFYGEQPTEAEQLLSARYWTAALIVAIAVPVLGLVLAGLTRSRLAAVSFGVLLIIGLLLALWLGPDLYRELSPDPPPQPHGTACQESSGGDNRCPGG